MYRIEWSKVFESTNVYVISKKDEDKAIIEIKVEDLI